ncbi:MAG: hypothetical protein R2727_11375 [Bacteroidales bacterium]
MVIWVHWSSATIAVSLTFSVGGKSFIGRDFFVEPAFINRGRCKLC